MRIYAIGDIHGQLERLREAHDRIERDGGADAPVIHLGDLIDKGPESRGVVELLMDGQVQGRKWIVLKGNHDRALPNFLRDPRWIDPRAADQKDWISRDVGAEAALASYGVADAGHRPLDEVHAEAVAAVPPDHARWLLGLPAWYLGSHALFVHAGIRPGIDLRAQAEDDLLWIRKPFHDDRRDHGALVVHGHTPVRRPTHYGNRVNIDTGAGDGGPLTAIRLDEGGLWVLDDTGASPLTP
ncbi:metallophosphoesterase family protein [Paracoccus sp. MC1862]|uniref:metallophosphoesterase family protein n=1 Tax=Paracoccus sp. MC1862 TaxID=2760307 RepID=UPI0015FFD2D8|nr:metallophosphoesterase family protein [Paracoccus sp. MC1862]MBB1498481.1 serine/threonine protein phosphatase [Paracoccus sp. MC1862]QQO43832.1 serine/threonine protein phosphatase [Paracoccus sp. MC1862]